MSANLSAQEGNSAVLHEKNIFVRYLSPEELGKAKLYGYSLQKEAAIAIGMSADAGADRRILVFGLPGSGVSAFAKAFVHELREKCGDSTPPIHVSCEDIVLAHDVQEATNGLEKQVLEKMLNNIEKGRLTVLILDKPEALSYRFRNFYTIKATVTEWLSHFLKRQYPKTLMLCMSDDPSYIESSLAESFKFPIYLKYLNVESIDAILENALRRDDTLSISKRIYDEMISQGFVLVSAEITKALKEVREDDKNLKNSSTEQATNFMIDHIIPCYPISTVSDYEERNKEWVSRSSSWMLNYWTRMHDDSAKI